MPLSSLIGFFVEWQEGGMRKSSVEGEEKRFGKIFFVGLWSVGSMRKKSANLRGCSPHPARSPLNRTRKSSAGNPFFGGGGGGGIEVLKDIFRGIVVSGQDEKKNPRIFANLAPFGRSTNRVRFASLASPSGRRG